MSIIGMTHPDTRKRVDVFALSIYELVIFSKALGQIDDVVSDLFDRLDKRPLLKGRIGLLLSILQELLTVERIHGYLKVRQHF
ncbi:hypothetical protein Godav_019558 [Gossypium davidsonii]|uniref:Uncharacterized protein n=1 Tax=Gossypium davidsonii TaxID=34287 RepID=A0A7J8R045_GOSDV|nr:hypothetical protein [Gossypium davidsonii]